MQFTNTWFQGHVATWDAIVPTYNPSKILEVGSYEGQSICHLIQLMGKVHPLEVDCIDTWAGGQEHSGINMSAVEQRFDHNVAKACSSVPNLVNVVKIKSHSFMGLTDLVAQKRLNYYDLIYIDGSHETPDVLADLVIAFRLLRVGGLMILDDYLWGLGVDAQPLLNPKLAIDSFLNCYQRKIQPHPFLPNYQLYCRKLSD